MAAAIADPNARRAPRTSSSVQWRGVSSTETLAPSHKPSARNRHASASPQCTLSTVAREPAVQAESVQLAPAESVDGTAGCLRRLRKRSTNGGVR